jgi:hypothetical protein
MAGEASRINGRKGGRPKGSTLRTPYTKAVEFYTAASTISQAKRLIRRATPYRRWMLTRPGPAARAEYLWLLRHLAEIVAGQHPDRCRIVTRRVQSSV